MASPQLQTLLQMLKAQPQRESSGAWDTQSREDFEKIAAFFPLAADVTRTPADADGVKGEWITVPNSSERVTILYVHGGGYVIGSLNTHADCVSRIARAAGARAFSVDYRLAPENPFPAAVEDATTAYRWLLKQNTDPKSIVIAGDSAGGGLAAATLLALKDAGDPMPGGAVLISPWTDLTCTSETMTSREVADPILQPEVLRETGKLYADGATQKNPHASPIFGDYSGLPPILVQVGDAEILLDDSRVYAERAKAAGVDCTLEVWDEMIHVFQLFAPMLPEGQQAIEKIGEWVRSNVGAKVSA